MKLRCDRQRDGISLHSTEYLLHYLLHQVRIQPGTAAAYTLMSKYSSSQQLLRLPSKQQDSIELRRNDCDPWDNWGSWTHIDTVLYQSSGSCCPSTVRSKMVSEASRDGIEEEILKLYTN